MTVLELPQLSIFLNKIKDLKFQNQRVKHVSNKLLKCYQHVRQHLHNSNTDLYTRPVKAAQPYLLR